MQFIALRSNVKDAISTIERASGENLNLPILRNVLISITDAISFTATNLDISITSRLSGKVIEKGNITVPIALLSNLINNIQGDRLNFEKKDESLTIKTDNYQATIQGIPAEEFPVTPQVGGGGETLGIKGALLKDALQETIVAAQFSDLRPELNTILFDFALDTIKLVATDGFRLAEKTIPQNLFSSSHKEPFKILIPLKTGQEAARIIKKDEMVKISHGESQVVFRTDGAELISRLVEGSFPDYLPLIPKEFSLEAVVNREEFLNAIKLASIFGQRTNEVKIAAAANKKVIEVSSSDQSLGENSYLIPAKIKGDAAETFFNWRYLADPVRAMEGEELFIGLQEEGNPALLRPSGDASYLYILKPILKS